jgi:hypothetical protein
MCRVSGTGYRGCRFEVLSEDDRGMTLKFRSTLRWGNSAGDVPENEVFEGHRVRKLDDPLYRVLILEGKSKSHCMRISPLPKVISWHFEDQPFSLSSQTDINSWCKPKWFRLETFPFTTTTDAHSDNWAHSHAPSFWLTWLPGMIPILLSIKDSLPWSGLYIFPFIFIRGAYGMLEYAIWQRWLARHVQQRWAATFHDNESAQKLLSSSQPTVTFTLWTHIPMFVAACILLFSAWLSSTQRSTYIWIAVTLSIEPVIRLGLMKYRSARQHLEATGYTEPLPFRPNIAISIGVTLLIPLIWLGWKGLSTSISIPEELPTSNLQREAEIQRMQTELRRLELAVSFYGVFMFLNILYWLGVAIWLIGLPGFLYSSFLDSFSVLRNLNL